MVGGMIFFAQSTDSNAPLFQTHPDITLAIYPGVPSPVQVTRNSTILTPGSKGPPLMRLRMRNFLSRFSYSMDM